MVYASLDEAFGGISGSNFLSTRLEGDLHPIHKKKFEEEEKEKEKELKRKHENNEYTCTYRDGTCDDAFHNNLRFNHQQKINAIGLQPFPVNYTFSPQYPWYPMAKHGYLNYANDISSMFYNDPYKYFPRLAYDLQNYQNKHRMVENFSSHEEHQCTCHKTFKIMTTYFIFFLISLAIVMSIFMICSMK